MPDIRRRSIREVPEYAVHPALRHAVRRCANGCSALVLLAAALVTAPVLASASGGASGLASPPVSAMPGEPLLAACDRADFARILTPARHAQTTAAGQWMDRTHVLWSGMQAGGRFRLLASADAGLEVRVGERARGVGRGIALQPRGFDLPEDLTARYAWVPRGQVLALPPLDDATLAELLRGQLLLVREDAQGRVQEVTGLQLPGVLDALYQGDGIETASDTHPLGASFEGERATLRLWAPTARAVSACLFDGPTTPVADVVPLARESGTGFWTMQASGLRNRHLLYLVDVFVPGTGIVRNRVTDPYSVSLSADSQRTLLLDLDAPGSKPDGWDTSTRPAPLAAMTDMAIYELHVRDFSRDDASVPPPHRGRYLAFAEPDSTGVQHLRALREAGITDIHLLPVFDLASIPEVGCVTPHVPQAAPDSPAQQAAVMAVAARDCFNWGYDPWHYSAPEGSYASDAMDGAVRVREFRAMVQALHGLGLRVGMDVVYNHTHAAGQDAQSVLDRIVPGYYQRLDAEGKVETSTCCANTATEHAMMGRLMRDSIALWAGQYRIDSFRFDLMGHQPLAAMHATQRAADAAASRHVQLIGEGWNFGEVAHNARFAQAAQGELAGSNIASFSDRARDAARGGGCCDGGEDLVRQQGWLNGLHLQPNALNVDAARKAELLAAADMLRAGLAGTLRDYRMTLADGRDATLAQLDYKGAAAGYAAAPGEVVNYVENHDNPTLFDINALRLPLETPAHERARVQTLGAALVAFSQGIAYFHAGQELLRSKSLDRNSFDSGDWFNRLDFTGTHNGFGAGLPPAQDNGGNWPWLRPVLATPGIQPAPADIAFARAAFNDLLRIRSSSTLFRMPNADDVHQRLRFRNTGPRQNPAVLVGHLDGRGYAGAGFAEVLYLLNTAPQAQTLHLPEDAGKRWRLHPVQAARSAADARVREQARVQVRTGRFTVPGRSAVVFVVDTESGR